MIIRLEPSSGVPIVRQIVDQISTHCARGTLATGDRLPSVRELARELAVNPNTILHAYERLTHLGLLDRRQGEGTFVADKLPPGRAKAQRGVLASEMDRLAHRLVSLGIDDEAAQKLLTDAMERARRELRNSTGRRAYG